MLRKTWMALAAALVFLAACGKETKTAETIAEDSALAHDITMAGRDSLAEPVMTDLSTGSPSVDGVTSAPEPGPVSPASTAPKSQPRVQASVPRSQVKTQLRTQPARVTEASRLAASAPAVSLATPTTDPATGREVPARPRTSAPPLPLPETPPPEADEPETDKPETAVAESEPDNRVRAGSEAAPAPRAGGGRVLDPASGEPSAYGTIPAGVALALNTRSRICTNIHSVGQTFNATVARSVSGAGGAVIPAGAIALVEITELRRGGADGDPIRMGFRVSSVSFGGNSYPVNATATSAAIARIRKKSSSGQAEAISPSSEADGCVPTGGRINARLNSSIRF